MATEGQKWGDEVPVLATGVGLEALAVFGGIEVLENSHNIAIKVLELGAVGLVGAAGIAAMGYFVDRTRDRRYARTHAQVET